MPRKRAATIIDSRAKKERARARSAHPEPHAVPDDALDFYLQSLELLNRSRIAYMVGGAYALKHYANIIRYTKDLDIFVRPADVRHVITFFDRRGFNAELIFPHWLGKVFDPVDSSAFIDVIFGSGNGLCPVDQQWFDHAVEGDVFGFAARIVPVEEMIWSKAFVCERERYDGADILHLIQARGKAIDWRRLLSRFAGHEPVLLSHLLLFDYVYPDECDLVPAWVFDTLTGAARDRREIRCRGATPAVPGNVSLARTIPP